MTLFVVAGVAAPSHASIAPPLNSEGVTGTASNGDRAPITPPFGLPYSVPTTVTTTQYAKQLQLVSPDDLSQHANALARDVDGYVPAMVQEQAGTTCDLGGIVLASMNGETSKFWTVLELDEVAPVTSNTNPLLGVAGSTISDMVTTSSTRSTSESSGITAGGTLSAKFAGSGADGMLTYTQMETDTVAYSSGENQTATVEVLNGDIGKYVSLETRAAGGNYVGYMYSESPSSTGHPIYSRCAVAGFVKAPGVRAVATWDKVVTDPQTGFTTTSSPDSPDVVTEAPF